jgi:hypothetical protein
MYCSPSLKGKIVFQSRELERGERLKDLVYSCLSDFFAIIGFSSL